MVREYEKITEELVKRKIKPSFHRMKVLEYLTENQNHPTVEQIFTSLQKELPTLSKATIYNTLNLFVESGLARAAAMGEKETRYDMITENHGHFKCESCGTIYDFDIEIDRFFSEELKEFQVNVKDVYFKGICQRCLKIKRGKLKNE